MDKSKQGNWNNDPTKQPVNVDAVKNTDPKGKPSDNPNAVAHQSLQQQDQFKESGKDIGLVNSPITSINPTSGTQLQDNGPEGDDIEIIDEPNRYLNADDKKQQNFKYPFDKVDIGQGFFVPVEKGNTTDALMGTLHRDIAMFREATGECEKDINGDDVWESVVIQTKKRKDNVIQLDGAGKPIVGANQTNRPKLIYSANFIARAVVKGDEISDGQEAETDGVLVIRVV